MSKIIISVIIPAHNEERLIGRCLWSLKFQKKSEPYEIIVVNNNSTDKTTQIIKALKIKMINETIPGPGPARNAGAKAARGSILAFTDADSIPPPNWLNHIYKAFKANPNIVALIGSFQFKNTTNLLKILQR